ncbi:unnamed protein product [Cochlearia groenlandica]
MRVISRVCRGVLYGVYPADRSISSVDGRCHLDGHDLGFEMTPDFFNEVSKIIRNSILPVTFYIRFHRGLSLLNDKNVKFTEWWQRSLSSDLSVSTGIHGSSDLGPREQVDNLNEEMSVGFPSSSGGDGTAVVAQPGASGRVPSMGHEAIVASDRQGIVRARKLDGGVDADLIPEARQRSVSSGFRDEERVLEMSRNQVSTRVEPSDGDRVNREEVEEVAANREEVKEVAAIPFVCEVDDANPNGFSFKYTGSTPFTRSSEGCADFSASSAAYRGIQLAHAYDYLLREPDIKKRKPRRSTTKLASLRGRPRETSTV